MMEACKSDLCEAPDDTEYVEDILDSKMRAFQEVCSVQKSIQTTTNTVAIPEDFVSFRLSYQKSSSA